LKVLKGPAMLEHWHWSAQRADILITSPMILNQSN